MTIVNGFSLFIKLLKLRCGLSYFGAKCLMFIVSVVSPMVMDNIQQQKTSIASEYKLFEMLNEYI